MIEENPWRQRDSQQIVKYRLRRDIKTGNAERGSSTEDLRKQMTLRAMARAMKTNVSKRTSECIEP